MTSAEDKSRDAGTRLRLWVTCISLCVGVAFVVVMSVLFGPESMMGAFLLDRGTQTLPYPLTIQNAMWLIFFVGCGELWIRFRESSSELNHLGKKYLPEDSSSMLRAEDLGAIHQKIQSTEEDRSSFLKRLIKRCILQFQASRSIDQANSLFNSSLELFQHEIELKYNLLRYLVWLIPTLGFIGTVIGIAFALNYAGGVANPQDPTLLAEISGRLGVAFYTTLLALIQSAILVFALHIAESRDEMSLNKSGQYCLDNLINRLYEK